MNEADKVIIIRKFVSYQRMNMCKLTTSINGRSFGRLAGFAL